MNLVYEWRSSGLVPTRVGKASLRAGELVRWGATGVTSLPLLLCLLAVGVFRGVPVAAGQGSGSQEISTREVQAPFKVQVQRNMVLLRAIVRDLKGRPVPGLSKEDFRLWDNGKPQVIDQFAVESLHSATPLAAPAPGNESEEEAAPAVGAATATARNFQALYFDDTQMTFGDIVHARDAADRYLGATLTPADRAGIFTSSGQGNLDFTDDRSKLHDALFNLRPRSRISTGVPPCPDIGDYQAYLIVERLDPTATEIAIQEAIQCICGPGSDKAAQQMCQTQAQTVAQTEATQKWNQWNTQSEGVLRGLEQVIRRTALLPGQHNVIFLSPGFLLFNLESQIAELTDRALRANVVVNALDPRGLYTIIPGGDATRENVIISPGLMAQKQQIINQGLSLDEEVLAGLAADTGGQFFHNSNDLDQGFRQVGTLSEVYYILAFSPHDLKYDGRFHKLKVSLVNPTGSTIQARRGYFAPKASEDAATKAKEEIRQAVYSQDELRELPVDVHTQFFKLNDAEVRLAVLTHLDVSSVHFRQDQDRHLDKLLFLTVLFDRDGKYVMAKEKEIEFRLRDATLARLNQTGITLKIEFDLKPGTYLVRQIVRDSEAGQLSGLNRTVEIPY